VREVDIRKYLQMCGLGARRKVETLLKKGEVRINGRVAKPGDRVRIGEDRVTLGGRVLKPEPPVYILFHKPKGIITTRKDEKGRPTVMDMLRGVVMANIFPVGRLDRDSEGLLLLTNDGDFADIMLHPRYGKEKVYEVLVRGVKPRDIKKMLEGVKSGGDFLRAERVKVLKSREGRMLLEVVLREGKKRHIRRMIKALGGKVERLKRVAFGPFTLKGIDTPGTYRFLSPKEIEKYVEPLKRRFLEKDEGDSPLR
jgi:pseudouridine synthase